MKKKMSVIAFVAVMMICLFGKADVDAAEVTNLIFGKDYYGTFMEDQHEAWYKITMPSAGTIKISARSKEVLTLNYGIYLKAQVPTMFEEKDCVVQETKLGKQDVTGRLDSTVEISLAKGIYYLYLHDASYRKNADYNVYIQYIQGKETIPEGEYGSNNTIEKASQIVCDTDYTGFIAYNDRYDWYKFTIGKAGKVRLKMYTPSSQTLLYLHDANGNELWYDSTQSKAVDGGGNRVIDSISGSKTYDKELAPGTYYVKIQNSSHTGLYNLRVEHMHTFNALIEKATPYANGAYKQVCACGYSYTNQIIYAPTSIILSKTSYTYDGKTKTPSATVKDKNGNLISSVHYSVSYAKDRKKVGTYKVTITFKGTEYSGKITKAFIIKPKGTSISKLMKGKKRFTVKWKKQTSQTTGYEIQYSLKKSFKDAVTKTINKNKTTSATYKNLKTKKTYYVRIRTYKKVSGKNIYSSWSKVKSIKTK